MPIVEMPDGQQVQFPDEMPKEQIRGLIAQKFPDAVPQQKSTLRKGLEFGVSVPMGAMNYPLQLAEGGYNVLARGVGLPEARFDLAEHAPSKAGALTGELGAAVVTSPFTGLPGAITEGYLLGSAKGEGGLGAMIGAAGHGIGTAVGHAANAIGQHIPQSVKNQVYNILKEGGHLTDAAKQKAAEIYQGFQNKGVPVDVFSLFNAKGGIKLMNDIIQQTPEYLRVPGMKTMLEMENKSINQVMNKLKGGADVPHDNVLPAIKQGMEDTFLGAERELGAKYENEIKPYTETWPLQNYEPLNKVANKILDIAEKAKGTSNITPLSPQVISLAERLKVTPEQIENQSIGNYENGLGSVWQRIESLRGLRNFYKDRNYVAHPLDNKYVAELEDAMNSQIEHTVRGSNLKTKYDRIQKEWAQRIGPSRTPVIQDILNVGGRRQLNQDTWMNELLKDQNAEALKLLPQSVKDKIAYSNLYRKFGDSLRVLEKPGEVEAMMPEGLTASKFLNHVDSVNNRPGFNRLLGAGTKTDLKHLEDFRQVSPIYRDMLKAYHSTGKDLGKRFYEQVASLPALIGGSVYGLPGIAGAMAMKAGAKKMTEKRTKELMDIIFSPEFIEDTLKGEKPAQSMKGSLEQLMRSEKGKKGMKGLRSILEMEAAKSKEDERKWQSR